MKKIITLFITFTSLVVNSQTVYLDNTFGVNGRFNLIFNTTYTNIYNFPSRAVDLSGRFLEKSDYYINDYYVKRYTIDGLLDNSYGNNGLSYASACQGISFGCNYGNTERILFSNANNDYFLEGYEGSFTQDWRYLKKFSPNPSVNPSVTNCSVGHYKIPLYNGVKMTSDGSVLLVSHCTDLNGGPNTFSISKLNNSGILDSTFGNSGVIIHQYFSPNTGSINDVAFDSDNNSYVAFKYDSTYGPAPYYDWIPVAIRKFNNLGQPDTSFGNNGVLNFTGIGFVKSIVVLPDNKILVLEDDTAASPTPSLSRLNQNGSLDLTFGTNGIRQLNLLNGFEINRLRVIGSKIYLIGNNKSFNTTSRNAIICKLDQNGNFDPSLNSTGILSFPIANKHVDFIDIKLQPITNKILVFGSAVDVSNSSNRESFVLRYIDEEILLSSNNFDYSKSNLEIYPNPTNDFISFRNNEYLEVGDQFMIYNLMGIQVEKSKLDYSKSIDVTSLAKGLYFLNIKGSKIKFFKN